MPENKKPQPKTTFTIETAKQVGVVGEDFALPPFVDAKYRASMDHDLLTEIGHRLHPEDGE